MIQNIVGGHAALIGFALMILLSAKTPAQETSELKMRLFVARAPLNRPFLATLYIKGNAPNEKVTLQVPDKMALAESEKAEKDVPAAGEKGYAQVSWKVKASATGEYKLTIRTASGATVTERINVFEPTA
jgi:hypothetical protein